MVAVITAPGNNVYGVLAYNMKSAACGESVIISCNDMVFSPGGDKKNMGSLMESFKPYLDANRRTKYPIFHCSLNPHPEDKLDDLQLSVIAGDFMEQLGYGEQPYVVFKHTDTGRPHLHIVSVRVDREGKKLDHFKEGEKAGKIAAELEEKYGLIKARGRNEDQPTEVRKVDYNRGDLKRQMKSVLFEVMKRFDFQSYGELNTLLNLYGIKIEFLQGHVNGKPYEGIVYSAIDKKGERVCVPIKSSRLGKQFGPKAMAAKFSKSKERFHIHEHRIEEIRTVVDGVLKDDPGHNILLHKLQDINVLLRLNSNRDRITGVTFIDLQAGIVFKGSRIGKQYSANALNEKLTSDNFPDSEAPVLQEVLTYRDDFRPVDNDSPKRVSTAPESKALGYPLILHAQQELSLWQTNHPRKTEEPDDKYHITPAGPKEDEFEEYIRRKKKKGRNI